MLCELSICFCAKDSHDLSCVKFAAFLFFPCTLSKINFLTSVQEDDEAAKDETGADKSREDDARTATNISVRKLGVDHFNDEERDPKKSRAMSKSLLFLNT